MSVVEASTSRGLVKSMLVIGSAQAVNILISILRMKILSVLLGPSGVGLLSIYSSLQGLVQQASGLGMSSSGVRAIAASNGEEATLNRVRRVLLGAHLVQGALALLAVWVLRDEIAIWLFGDDARSIQVGLVGVAILLGLLSTAQTALLQGLRKINDLGRLTVLSTFISTLLGLAVVWLQGESGLIWFVLFQPLVNFVIALRYTMRLPKTSLSRPTLTETWEIWKPMAKLGAAFMLGGLATAATQLQVRSLITQELGLEAAGHFAAAWTITMTYVGFLLGAMAADYYPRLTEVINDRAAAIRLMNDQAQLGLAIGGPMLLLLIGLAPWAVALLYSAEFSPAVELLQWQMVGNVFKLAGWALSFSIVAAARSKTFFFTEISFSSVFLVLTWLFLPVFDLKVTGIAFLFGYIVYFTIVVVLVHRIQGFRWQFLSLLLLTLHTTLALALLGVARAAPGVAPLSSICLALVTGLFGLRIVVIKIGFDGRIAAHIARIYAAVGWPIPGSDFLVNQENEERTSRE